MKYILLTKPSESSINYVLKPSRLLLTIDSASDHFSTLAFESAIELCGGPKYHKYCAEAQDITNIEI